MKFSGMIGFYEGVKEVKPGIWKPIIVEKKYIGDVLRNFRRFQNSDKQTDDIITSNQLSIITNLYLRKNWSLIRYVIWNGVKLSVISIDISYPRSTLTLGGVYNEPNEIADARGEKVNLP